MTELAALKSYLIEKSGLQAEQIAQAEDYALTRNISLEEALVFLELIDYSVLGKRLAAIHGKPYVALLDKEPPKIAKARVSLKMAAKLRVFPVKYDSEKNILVLAVRSQGFIAYPKTENRVSRDHTPGFLRGFWSGDRKSH